MRLLLLLLLPALTRSQDADGESNLQLTMAPARVIPGLTPFLDLGCSPGGLAAEFREIFLIQLLKEHSGIQTPLATLIPNQFPVLHSGDNRVTVTGHLIDQSPSTASLKVHVQSPGSLDVGRVYCKIAGLSSNGNQVTYTGFVNVTLHPESNAVNASLKELITDLKKEADNLQTYVLALQQEYQRLAQQVSSDRQALTQKRAELQLLRSQAHILNQTVTDQENSLRQTAQDLVEEIANVSQNAPAMRVAFNAAEQTERVYPSNSQNFTRTCLCKALELDQDLARGFRGGQILFESEMENEGQGYNVSISSFRPPVAGLYYFTTSQLGHDLSTASTTVYSIRVNSTVIGSAYNGDDRQSSTFTHSTTSALVSLTPFDLVSVWLQYSTSATTTLSAYVETPDGLSTSFAGYLMN